MDIFFLYKWVSHGLRKNAVTNYLHPGNQEKITQKLKTEYENKNKNKYLVDMYIYKKALVCIWLYYASQI